MQSTVGGLPCHPRKSADLLLGNECYRKGWYVVEPSVEEARDTFSARRIIETGILREAGRPLQSVLRKLRQHIAQEEQAIEEADAAARSFLLADSTFAWPNAWARSCCAMRCVT
jgi:DNA-binding GntR family transcriptional regulator